jgi:hypothetical protein
MALLDRLLHALLAVLAVIVAIVFAALAWIEGLLGSVMTAAHIPANLQSVLAIVVGVLVLIAALRLFGGLIRVVLIVLLLAIVAHALSHHPYEPHHGAVMHTSA